MKKIKVSTVPQQADVEVIFVNSSLISKCLRAQITLERVINILKADGCIIPRYDQETDDNGCAKCTPVLNEKGEQIIDYIPAKLNAEDLSTLNEIVFPFLDELANAFGE